MTQMCRNQEVVDSPQLTCYHLSLKREVLETVKYKQEMSVQILETERIKAAVINRLTLVTTGRERVKADIENTICI
jgi:hypothetical protein